MIKGILMFHHEVQKALKKYCTGEFIEFSFGLLTSEEFLVLHCSCNNT